MLICINGKNGMVFRFLQRGCSGYKLIELVCYRVWDVFMEMYMNMICIFVFMFVVVGLMVIVQGIYVQMLEKIVVVDKIMVGYCEVVVLFSYLLVLNKVVGFFVDLI